jgi:hypothetical protein
MQNNNKFGCLTGTGIFSALITVIVITGIAFASGTQMFSAGELNAQVGDETLGGVTAHAQIAECSKCHTAFWETDTMADRCMTCHQDVAAQLFKPNSLHSVIMQKSPGLACRMCHPEHRGETAPLTEMNKIQFPHDSFGFSLNGHQLNILRKPFTCSDCHKNDISQFSVQTCDECHRQLDLAFIDAHNLAYGMECLACHDGVDRYGKNFNHATFFALEGKHAALTCDQCHGVARSAIDFQSASADCASCHQKDDAHAGAFGTACAVCHSPEAWKPAKFNHDLAAFKLAGKHVNVACETCHVNNVYKGTPTACYACHQKDDEHNGSFGTTCETCHNAADWDKATFDHNLSAFKLDGEHANVTCEKCHVNNVFKGTPTACYACHQKDDKHNGSFGTECSGCHTTASWKGATFDHSRTNFPLNGGHARVQCEQCHKGGVFTGISITCVSCHADPAFHAGALGTQCESCHNTTAWVPARFNLAHPEPRVEEGGSGIRHGGATCRQCHPVTVRQSNCDACHRGGFEGGGDGND